MQALAGVPGDLAGLAGDQSARDAPAAFAADRLEPQECVVHDALALRGGQYAAAQADERTGGDLEDAVGDGLAAGLHLEHLPLALAHQHHHRADGFVRAVDDQFLDGLAQHTVDHALDDDRAADRKLEALAAHGLQQDAQVQHAASGHDELVGPSAGLDPQGHVVLQLPLQTAADLPAGDVLTVLPGEGRVVDAEGHRDGRLVDGDGVHGVRMIRIADGVADLELVHPRDRAEVARVDLGAVQLAQARETLERGDLGVDLLEPPVLGVLDQHHRHAHADGALRDPPHADAPEILRVVQGGHLHAQGLLQIHVGVGHMLDDGLEHRLQILLLVRRPGVARPAFLRRGINHGEVQGVVLGAQRHQQVEALVDHALRVAVRPVALVDDDHGAQPGLQGLGEHEAGLGHGALEGVDHQQAAVGHAEDALDLAAEVGVARGVDDVDAVDLFVPGHIADGAVLGEDGDAPLALEGVGVHDQAVLPALELLQLTGAEVAGLLEQLVNQGGLPMVNVSDDGDIAERGDRSRLGDGGHMDLSVGVGSEV